MFFSSTSLGRKIALSMKPCMWQTRKLKSIQELYKLPGPESLFSWLWDWSLTCLGLRPANTLPDKTGHDSELVRSQVSSSKGSIATPTLETMFYINIAYIMPAALCAQNIPRHVPYIKIKVGSKDLVHLKTDWKQK